MGVLDDAIREHLELKRQHGAPEAEVKQKEREVLGQPASRPAPSGQDAGEGAGPEAAPDGEAGERQPSASESAAAPRERPPEPGDGTGARGHAVESEASYDAPTEIVPPDDVGDVEAGAGGPPAPPAPPPRPEQAVEGAPPAREPGRAPEPGPDPDSGSAPEPDADEGPAGDTPARGFEQVEDAPLPADDAGDEDEDEDVLEETPEFLQETPEHDRLWFEQRPPRDFDFDE